MHTHNLGYPRIGNHRELKKASEAYWNGQSSISELEAAGQTIRLQNWQLQQTAGIQLIPSNDFSFYDQVLDATLTFGAIPARYEPLKSSDFRELYFAMARGYQKNGLDLTAMEMTKWFDTNYHYIVPEFTRDQVFELFSHKPVAEFREALALGIRTKPVLLGPVSYLLLGKEKEPGFDKLDLMSRLLPVYEQLLHELLAHGAEVVQMDEPFLALDLSEKARNLYAEAYTRMKARFPELKILLATYFEGLEDHLELAVSLPADILHIDLVRSPEQLDKVLSQLKPTQKKLSLGVVDGRNVWKNDYSPSLKLIRKAVEQLGSERVLIAPSCSLLHTPCDLDLEEGHPDLHPEVKNWLAFARQKLDELVELSLLAEISSYSDTEAFLINQHAIRSRRASVLTRNEAVQARLNALRPDATRRQQPFAVRRPLQHEHLQLPLFPTTTIGSFPQTQDIRQLRADFRKGRLTAPQYEAQLKKVTEEVIRLQEAIGLDVLVHGEFERNDMVEYFGEQLDGFTFTRFGWVQSYGSRCVKPPIVFGEVSRPAPMTVKWSAFAQSLTAKTVKGMLTGPVTILQWSFVRDDQPRSTTCLQIALAIRDEVHDLEAAGIKAIQVDEPAIREGLPLRLKDRSEYLDWAVKAFKLATSGVRDETQVHTHMCYSEFNDIIDSIAAMDADVITIECSRSQMELLDAFGRFAYPNEIGPGVYDIHSPRVPSKAEMVHLMEKACEVIPPEQLWVNPDCGLKTRNWPETREALMAMVQAAAQLRESITEMA